MNRVMISALMVFALVSAMISPACAFVNGSKSFIEICAADGSAKTIAVENDQTSSSDQHHKKAQPDCAFCFSTAHAKPFTTQTIEIKAPLASNFHSISAGQITPRNLFYSLWNARAPPSLSA
jgi:hypothetical protein